MRPIVAIDATRDGKWLAVARAAEVGALRDAGAGQGPARSSRAIDRQVPGQSHGACISPPTEASLITASGVAGLGGVAAIWNVADGTLIREFAGHRDILYDAELSPDGKRLATCGYDKQIEIWDADSGKLLRTLEGHTGAVYDVAFSPDSRFLVSASADDTCKVWRVEDGQRMDTLPQPLKAEYTCAFSPDGQSIVAAGADNNIRVWRFVSRNKPEINPMVIARFAHEGPIVRLAFTPDGSKLVSLAEDRTDQGLANQRLQRAPALGEPARRARRRWRSPATSAFLVGRHGRVSGELRDPRGGRPVEAATALCKNSQPSESTSLESLARSPSTSRIMRLPQAQRALPASRPGHRERSRARQHGPVGCRPLPLRRQSRRAVGVRGERGSFVLEARLVPRGARRARAIACRACCCRRCAIRTSRSGERTTPSPAIFASSTGRR